MSPDRPGSVRLAVLLLAVTVLTTLIAGFLSHISFVASSTDSEIPFANPFREPTVLLQGLPFSLALLAILLAHEMGHYLACRFYRIRCTLPYVIPAPPFLNPFGTFGAVIRIRSPFRSRQQIFDVGIAGPLAGFLVILPVLALGVSLSTQFHFPEQPGLLIQYGEPFLFKLAVWSFFDGGPFGHQSSSNRLGSLVRAVRNKSEPASLWTAGWWTHRLRLAWKKISPSTVCSSLSLPGGLGSP